MTHFMATMLEGNGIVAATAVIALTMLYLVARWTRRYLENMKPFEELPMAKNSHWIFGHAGMLMTGQKNWQETFNVLGVDSANEYGQTGFWVFNLRMVNVNNWKDARTGELLVFCLSFDCS